MKINEMMRLVAAGYGDGGTDAFWDYGNEMMDCEGTGDTLAEFVVREIHDTFDPQATEDEQMEEAIRVMKCAERQIHDLVYSLGHAQDKLNREKKDNPIEDFAEKHGGYWDGEHPGYIKSDWRAEVQNGDTLMSYWEWAYNSVENES